MKTTEVLVKDLTKKVIAVREDTSVKKILELLKKEKIIPIVDKNNVLIGIVGEQDLIKLIKSEPSPLAGTVWSEIIDKSQKDKPVKEIMNTTLISVSVNDTIDSALRIMNNYNLPALVVTDLEGKVVGTIKLRDIFENFLKEG
ncbi:MAG: CBS domain-containing protein [Candidatus Aenigmatarchaeota archaeon]